jgi:hypothetical protein
MHLCLPFGARCGSSARLRCALIEDTHHAPAASGEGFCMHQKKTPAEAGAQNQSIAAATRRRGPDRLPFVLLLHLLLLLLLLLLLKPLVLELQRCAVLLVVH